MSKTTTGQVPPPTSYAAGEVIEDGLYIACGHISRFTNEVYRLDLNTWMWEKLQPKGTRPLKSSGMASWVSGSKMFILGGIT